MKLHSFILILTQFLDLAYFVNNRLSWRSNYNQRASRRKNWSPSGRMPAICVTVVRLGAQERPPKSMHEISERRGDIKAGTDTISIDRSRVRSNGRVRVSNVTCTASRRKKTRSEY